LTLFFNLTESQQTKFSNSRTTYAGHYLNRSFVVLLIKKESTTHTLKTAVVHGVGVSIQMVRLLISIFCLLLSSNGYADYVFIGKATETHIYARPLSLERLVQLGIPHAKVVYEVLNGSNSCGIQVTKVEISEVLHGEERESTFLYNSVGEWCEPRFKLQESKLYHLIENEPFHSVREYEYFHDVQHGLVIPGPGKSGLKFMGVPFSKHLVKLSEPIYTQYLEVPEIWKEAHRAGEVSVINGRVWYNTGIPVKSVIEIESKL
jgi:hypothetical protein